MTFTIRKFGFEIDKKLEKYYQPENAKSKLPKFSVIRDENAEKISKERAKSS